MLVDYHIHTKECGHARGEMPEYVEAAIARGLPEMGFSDHMPLPYLPLDEEYMMPTARFPEYLAEVARLQEKYPRIRIRLGVEADFIPGYTEQLVQILSGYPLDYVYGSVHFIDGWLHDDSRFIDGYERHGVDNVYRDYFRLVQGAAESGVFDILSHLDLVKKFGFRPQRDIRGLLEETVAAVAESGKCIEINTSGLRKPVREIYPGKELLELLFGANVPVTLGSDAHAPEEVAGDFDQAVALLRRVGYRKIATFRKRQRYLVDL